MKLLPSDDDAIGFTRRSFDIRRNARTLNFCLESILALAVAHKESRISYSCINSDCMRIFVRCSQKVRRESVSAETPHRQACLFRMLIFSLSFVYRACRPCICATVRPRSSAITSVTLIVPVSRTRRRAGSTEMDFHAVQRLQHKMPLRRHKPEMTCLAVV